MKGRKPTPKNLKVLRGNPGKRPLNEAAPEPETGRPDVPPWLDENRAELFGEVADYLENMGVLTTVDGHALALLVDAYMDYLECQRVVDREGRTYETVNQRGGIMIRARPEVTMASDAWRRVASMMASFGLEPSSRTKLKVEPKKSDPLGDYLNRGKKQA